jgi:hypothetical protein
MALSPSPHGKPGAASAISIITRFDAIETVNEWSSALDRLLHGVRAIRVATQWEGIENLEVARQACQLIRLLPPLETKVDSALLSLTLESSSAHALSRWAELVMSALEALTGETCERGQRHLGGARRPLADSVAFPQNALRLISR